MMRAYSYELKAAAVAEGKENTSARILMGEMYEIYYNNRDLRYFFFKSSFTTFNSLLKSEIWNKF